MHANVGTACVREGLRCECVRCEGGGGGVMVEGEEKEDGNPKEEARQAGRERAGIAYNIYCGLEWLCDGLACELWVSDVSSVRAQLALCVRVRCGCCLS